MKKKYFMCYIMILAVFVSSCDNDNKIEEELNDEIPVLVAFNKEEFDANKANWNNLNLQNYTYEFGYTPLLEYKISVEQGAIVKADLIGSNSFGYLTIDQIFEEIEDNYPEDGKIVLGEDQVSYLKEIHVVYHSEYYYPIEVKYIYGVTEPVEIDGLFHRFVNAFSIED